MIKPFIAILLVFVMQSALLADSFWENILANYTTLSKTDPLESFIDEQMQKIGIPLNTMAETAEKYFGLKFKQQYFSGGDSDPYCICIDSGGFYIIVFASYEDGVQGETGLILLQLYKPSKLTCQKKKILDISQTFLNKQSNIIRDRLKGLSIEEHNYVSVIPLPSKPIFTYTKIDYFPYDTDKEWLLYRNVDFAFSENARGIVDGYYMLMIFESVRNEGQTLSDRAND